MQYVEAPQEYPGSAPSIYLGGGISDCENWQQQLITLLARSDLVVLNPRRVSFPINDPSAAQEQIEWEFRHLERATIKLFWFPPQTLCPITLFELGAWSRSEAPLVVGAHPEYKRREDIVIQMELARPDVNVVDSLEELAEEVHRLRSDVVAGGAKPQASVAP
jgi:hypothetical protein